jgi:hypothetical protein
MMAVRRTEGAFTPATGCIVPPSTPADAVPIDLTRDPAPDAKTPAGSPDPAGGFASNQLRATAESASDGGEVVYPRFMKSRGSTRYFLSSLPNSRRSLPASRAAWLTLPSARAMARTR